MNVIELDWLKRWGQYAPDHVAIRDGESGRELTYSNFFRQAVAGAEFLKSRFGIGRGDRVAVLSLNELEYVVLFFALKRLGAVLVPVNYRLTPREMSHIISDSEPKLLVHQEDFQGVILELPADQRPSTLLLQGPGSFAESLTAPPTKIATSAFDARFDDPCMIIYTSGTTGAPKGAVLSHEVLFWNSINTSLRLNISQSDSTVIFLPFFHTGGWNVLTTPFLHRGATVTFLRKFDADQILRLSEDTKATLLFGVPTTMDMMARSPMFNQVGLKSLRYSIVGGEPMPIELIRIWHDKGVPTRQGYGLTEFGPNVFSLNEQDAIRKIGSIGFANFYSETKIVDDEGREVPTGEIGELLLRGPMCMSGYWRNEKATKETIVDGWLKTGDLVRCDDEGYHYVVGRKKDMFKSGGENVYPAELEKVIRALPGVREAAVIGVPDDKWGEVGRAYIVRENEGLTEDLLYSHCQQNLAKFKIPKSFVFLPELPKGDSGKILKKQLRESSQA